MIDDALTTRLDPRAGLVVRVAAPKRSAPAARETLKLGCVVCGSPHHGRLACPSPLAIADERDGVS